MRAIPTEEVPSGFLENSTEQLAHDAKRTQLRLLHHQRSWCGAVDIRPLNYPLNIEAQDTPTRSKTELTFLGSQVSPIALQGSINSPKLYPVSAIADEAIASQTLRWLEQYALQGSSLLSEKPSGHSFALYDPLRLELILYRSHESQEAIYWYHDSKQFLFSPTLSGLFETGRVAAKPCKESIAQYLYLGVVPDDICLAKNVHKIAPGQALVYDLEKNNFWHLSLSDAGYLNSHKPLQQGLESSFNVPISFASTLDPITQLWYLQEPRFDLWISYRFVAADTIFSRLQQRWLQEFSLVEEILKNRPPSTPWPLSLQKIGTWLEIKTSTFGLGKYLRHFLQQLYYRPFSPYCQALNRLSFFNASKISFKFKGLHQNFCPHIWFQEQLSLKSPTQGQSLEQEARRKLLQICAQRSISPIWSYHSPRPWTTTPWPWMSLQHQQQLLDSSNRSFKSPLEPLTEILPQDFHDLKLALHRLYDGILIDEAIASTSELSRLIRALDKGPMASEKDRLAFYQASTLVALELWLRVFIDRQGRLSPENSSWQRLMDIPMPNL